MRLSLSFSHHGTDSVSNLGLLSYMASYDMASNIYQALGRRRRTVIRAAQRRRRRCRPQ
jgi:hypothetical protein